MSDAGNREAYYVMEQSKYQPEPLWLGCWDNLAEAHAFMAEIAWNTDGIVGERWIRCVYGSSDDE